jgi:integrase
MSRLAVASRVDGGGLLTVAEWLEVWVETRARLRDGTRRAYRGYIRVHLRRQFRGVLLAELTTAHVQRAFASMIRVGMTVVTARRLFSVLRSALNAAAREGLLAGNPARYVELPKGRRPLALVWTSRRVAEWERTGVRPPVAVWTAEQTAVFLAAVAGHPLFAAFHLMAMRGLRRGEACGLWWEDLDLDEGLAYVSRQVQTDSTGVLRVGSLKSESSRRAVALDPVTVAVLRAHHETQHGRSFTKARGNEASGWVFTSADGGPLTPDYLTRTFVRLLKATGLPPVRLHDLRHGAATLMLAAGADLKTIADQLGHASVVLTADTYLSVAVELSLTAAAEAARLVLRAGRYPPGTNYIRSHGKPALAA